MSSHCRPREYYTPKLLENFVEDRLHWLPISMHYASFGPNENPVDYVMSQLSPIYPAIYQDTRVMGESPDPSATGHLWCVHGSHILHILCIIIHYYHILSWLFSLLDTFGVLGSGKYVIGIWGPGVERQTQRRRADPHLSLWHRRSSRRGGMPRWSVLCGQETLVLCCTGRSVKTHGGRFPTNIYKLYTDTRTHTHINIYIYILFKRLRATAGQGPTMLAHLVAMLAYVGLIFTHVEPKDPKNGNSKKTVKRRIFWWSAAYLGAMLAHRGAMLAYLDGNVGPSWGYVGLSWGYVGPSWSYVGPSWGYVGPSWGRKMGTAKKHCKTQEILMVGGLFWGHVGPSWAMLAYLEGNVGPSSGYVGPSWGYVGPS